LYDLDGIRGGIDLPALAEPSVPCTDSFLASIAAPDFWSRL
jgi:hypothetical protein